ncbi:aspartyl-phosphate phosphatase Spo0E family protein [Fictibacillus sp. Mic-4]|uniref:Spo0E family sporulation regulatory protein-aspartic acid phosphatase n=1 Tax=Fictibacillus sp. Mic-4 TaxID=3132826 RepID=UPI003CF28FC4
MSKEVTNLSEQIDKVRQEMYESAKTMALSDPKLISISKNLDNLLNEYHKCMK